MTVAAHAKVNLTLEVFGRRPDGFHALRSTVLPIELFDELTFSPADSFSTDTGYPDDLILKAARTLADRRGQSSRIQPFRIAVAKRIPAGGGLGGGSADAAATLLALNVLWNLGMSPEELAEIGAVVGSDVPALVLANHYRRPVLMEGRGEKVSLLPAVDDMHLVLVGPGVASSTPAVYAAFDAMGDEPGMPKGKNDLQAPAVSLYPEIGSALEALRRAGVHDVMMSGSGSTVFGFANSEADGRDIANRLTRMGLRAWSVGALR